MNLSKTTNGGRVPSTVLETVLELFDGEIFPRFDKAFKSIFDEAGVKPERWLRSWKKHQKFDFVKDREALLEIYTPEKLFAIEHGAHVGYAILNHAKRRGNVRECTAIFFDANEPTIGELVKFLDDWIGDEGTTGAYGKDESILVYVVPTRVIVEAFKDSSKFSSVLTKMAREQSERRDQDSKATPVPVAWITEETVSYGTLVLYSDDEEGCDFCFGFDLKNEWWLRTPSVWVDREEGSA